MRIHRSPLAALLYLGLLGAHPQDDLKAKFEAKKSDPLAALRVLSEQPGESARLLARPFVSRTLTLDLAAGLKAFGEGKADLVERHFTRAALLADPYGPELSRQLMRMFFLMKQARKTITPCATCKGAGASPCTACKDGLVLGNCPRCEAKGIVNCLLCDGSGELGHHGYKGKFVLTLSDTPVHVGNAKGTLHGQIVTYMMDPCASGSFHLKTENVITCPHKNLPNVKPITFDGQKPCGDFWKEMKLFAFNGKAKMQVNNPQGQLTIISSQAARRFFADYEICKSGKIPCDRCLGKKTDACSYCQGKGKANILCTTCEGTGLVACATCRGYGDASWLSKALPAAPELSNALNDQAVALRDWLDARARLATRKEDLARRLEEAKRGVDPQAKVTPDYVDVACPKCKGAGGMCEDCWGSGRREYLEGSAQYERYAIVQRLERQLGEAQKTVLAPPPLAALPDNEAVGALSQKPSELPSAKRKPIEAPTIPKTVDEMVAKADLLHASGEEHLNKSKSARDNEVWIDEAHKALVDLKQAQILYATAQEKLDELGAPVPKELQSKFRQNTESLYIARKQSP
jgi:hypothetical protein